MDKKTTPAPNPQQRGSKEPDQNEKGKGTGKEKEGEVKKAAQSLSIYDNVARMINLYAKAKHSLPSPSAYRAESQYKGIKGPDLNRQSPQRKPNLRKVFPAPPATLTHKETIPTSAPGKPVQPTVKKAIPLSSSSPTPPKPRRRNSPPKVIFRSHTLPTMPTQTSTKKLETPPAPPLSQIRKKAPHKDPQSKKLKAQQKDPEATAQVEEVAPELQLLEDVDAGKVQEGFTAETFRKEKVQFVLRILKNTSPIRHLLKLTGRFPFIVTENEDGTMSYEASLIRPQGLYFLAVSLIVSFFLVLGSFNLMDLMLNLTFGDGRGRSEDCEEERMYETTLIDRNIVGFAGLWTALCHTTLTSVNLLFKRHYMAQYLSFWSVAAQTMHVDVATGIFKYSFTVVLFYVLIMTVLTLMSVYRVTASMAGMPSLFSILMFRTFFPCILQRNSLLRTPEEKSFEFSKTHSILEIVSGIFLVYLFILSKVLIIFFLHFCRMLVTAFKSWNARFHAVMNYPKRFMQSVEGRTTYHLLFKDHCTLLSLIEGTDRCFSTIVESYLALQLVSIILETYFVYRNVILKLGFEQMSHPRTAGNLSLVTDPFSGSPYFVRKYDFVPGLVILLSNVVILVVILKEAGRVSEVAREGLEVIRKKTMMGRKSDQELYFTLSMYFSYSSQTQMSLRGSGFFDFDNAFIITVLAVIFSNLITTIQFSPPLDPDYRGAKYSYQNFTVDDTRENIGAFIRDIEQLKDRHWVVGQDPNI